MGKKLWLYISVGLAALMIVIITILLLDSGPDVRLPYGIEPEMTFDEIDGCMRENGFWSRRSYDMMRFYEGGSVFGNAQYFGSPVFITLSHDIPDEAGEIFDAVFQAIRAEYGEPNARDKDGSPRWRDGKYELHLGKSDGGITVTYVYKE